MVSRSQRGHCRVVVREDVGCCIVTEPQRGRTERDKDRLQGRRNDNGEKSNEGEESGDR